MINRIKNFIRSALTWCSWEKGKLAVTTLINSEELTLLPGTPTIYSVTIMVGNEFRKKLCAASVGK